MTKRTTFEALSTSWRRWRLRSRTREDAIGWLTRIASRADIGLLRTHINLKTNRKNGLSRRG